MASPCSRSTDTSRQTSSRETDLDRREQEEEEEKQEIDARSICLLHAYGLLRMREASK